MTLLGSCASAPDAYYTSQPRCDTTQQDATIAGGCFKIPEVRSYLNQLQKQVLETWDLPGDLRPDQKVSVMFRVRLDGSLQCLSLIRAGDERLGRSVTSAFERAAPFGTLPPEGTCLAANPITATFSNPEAP
jgi:hypothetical protein